MKAIVLLSHGSVLCGSEQNLLALAGKMSADYDGLVEAGFLNYSEPSFESAVQKCIDLGASEVTVVPYFLVAGKFAARELPVRIGAVAERFPAIPFKLAEPMRFHPLLAQAVIFAAAESRPPAAWRSEINGAADFCRQSSRCPLFGHPPCPAALTTGVAR